MSGRRQRGYTLLEILVVVTIVGILAAILIPNLLNSIQKAKQKRTVADVRDTGIAWMSWLTDQIGAATAGAGKTYDASGFRDVTYADLFGYLHPTETFYYMQTVPEEDGWSNPLFFGAADNLQASHVLIICAGGRDGQLAGGDCTRSHELGPFTATDFDQDIIWADGYLIRWPSAQPLGE